MLAGIVGEWYARMFCHCRDFLLRDLPRLLEDIPLAVRARIWCMHDAATVRCSRVVRCVPNGPPNIYSKGRIPPLQLSIPSSLSTHKHDLAVNLMTQPENKHAVAKTPA
jgi:hypothetical protein